MEKIKKHICNLLFMYKQIFTISKSRILFIILQCLIDALNMVIDVFFVKYILDGLLGGYDYLYFILVISVKLFVMLAGQCCDNILYNYVYKRNDIKIQEELEICLFNNIKKIKLNKLEEPEYYDKYQKAISEISNREGALLDYLAYILSTFINIISLAAIIVTLDPVLIIISVIGMFVTLWANIINTQKVYNADMSFVKVDRKIDYIRRVFYLPQYAKDVRRTHLSDRLAEDYDKAASEKQALIKKHWPKIIGIAISGSWLYNVVNIGISYFYLAVRAIQKIVSISDITSLTYATNQLSNNLLQISNIIPQGIQHSLYIQNYRDMLNGFDEEDKYQSKNRIEITRSDDIKLDHVSFQYPSKETSALDDICLSIKKGEHIAIVGENGAGKTTLIKLLSALYEPTQGEISIGGINYQDISFESLSTLIGVCNQDFQHYAFSISDNLSLQSATREVDGMKLKDALEKVNMYDTVLNLENGMNSIYSREFDSEGVEFSGGQLQRLAIARVLYADAPILILDEPSSALDPMNEQNMFNTIFEVSRDKTLILVSHRLSCVKEVDRILVMDKGRIIEAGNHEELMELNGKYAQMFRLQSKRYGI